MMGKVAAQRADISIITSDNPRSEDAQEIIAAIVPGAREGAAESGSRFEVEADRARAIAAAICMAQARDTVLVAGKGHEDYQEINGVKHEFSDVVEAKRALHAWRSGVCA
jgi:UDP-N-acetylmuramoyl-L-alanyl-D-glutamate--2,6-diaminopimelate ligase